MWIKGCEYDRLLECEHMKDELEKEVERLAEMISAQVEDCKVGPWCNECAHKGHDFSSVPQFSFIWGDNPWVRELKSGEVYFCKKHLHEYCPEFEAAQSQIED